MPKKRTYNFKPLQGASSSNSGQAAGKNADQANSVSVNERLSELRKLEAKDAAAKKRQLAESVNQRSVPPEVRGLLGVPESAPPNPKAGVRARDRMRTPGPAPPKSWLANNSWWTPTLALRGGRRGQKKHANASDRSKPKELLRFARLAGLSDPVAEEKPLSLTHLSLRTIAESWDLFDEEDYPALAEIPLRLRLRLLSYICFYGPALDSNELQALLQGHEYVAQLDLAGLVGHGNLTVKKLARLLEKDQDVNSNQQQDVVAESWDVDESLEAALTPSLGVNRFSALTHLCLSHPKPNPSWRDLLALTKLTPQLTHLSLAYWSRPSLTPNLATATVSSQRSPDVSAGGSHYYSALDQDMSEPASLLRQLSNNLLCLQWLDLEGCQDWIPALTKLASNAPVMPDLTEASNIHDRDQWLVGEPTGASVISSNWKNLRYLRCAQGWLPSLIGIQALQERHSSALDHLLIDGIVKHLRDDALGKFQVITTTQDNIDTEKKRARMWLECEYRMTYACMSINSARRTQGCRPIGMDFGWIQRHAGPI